MSETVAWITRGNVAEVKIVIASIVAVLAIYQVVLMAVGYRKLSVPFLSPEAASRAHRAIGDTVLVLTLLTALTCVSYFEVEDENVAHAVLGTALLLVLALKVAVVRRWVRRDAWLPWLGISVLLLFGATWLTFAARFLG